MEQNTLLELRTTVQKFVRHFGLLEQSITPCGYSLSLSQVFALQELESKTLSVGVLADILLLDRSSVSRLVDQLVKANFVLRNINENNRRETLLSLTEKGRTTIHKVRQQSIHFYGKVLQDVSENDQRMITDGFKMFTTAITRVKGELKDEDES
ncbi:MarR family winged helix-turn-helix transcriptional regulator [Cohnella luojiensis]|uniref:MarR family transcriptional regulator n=1 Tax=Cohnella luojiensis TaxID=652876 RepID=A0A4Y8LMM9_9BACL|nr:MarR family transcriptional regulator [Cohnella luojiensis]TFE19296.1 MarR family transcriptional regulator [Cohnella luojiensis]